jgi:ribosomal protein S12 methylthiotransferase accessory factor YcaO
MSVGCQSRHAVCITRFFRTWAQARFRWNGNGLGIARWRALVTGSSEGIGAAIAEALAAEGFWVVVHGRDPDRTKAVAELISKLTRKWRWAT